MTQAGRSAWDDVLAARIWLNWRWPDATGTGGTSPGPRCHSRGNGLAIVGPEHPAVSAEENVVVEWPPQDT